MIVTPDSYVPSLRWRQGEYQALASLSDVAKSRVIPFIVIPEIEFDFEEWCDKKTMQEHLEPFPRRFKDKWGMRPAWIDIHPKVQSQKMDDGKLPIAYVFDELSVLGNKAVPVTSLDATAAINAAVAKIVKRDGRGLGLRLRIEHVMKPGCKTALDALILASGVTPDQVDLIVDLGAPNYQPYTDFADALIYALSLLGDLSVFRSYVLMGSAYPETVPLDKPGGELPRHDWLFYKTFVGMLGPSMRVPNYGDYTIVNPEFTPKDMRLIKAGGKVVYTLPASWFIRKGGAFRDSPTQMHDHCKTIVSSGNFRGASFSDGDSYIDQCAKHLKGPSTLSYWKRVAINHHITHVLDDLAMTALAA
ncbi:beta family protein [Phreatobacter stygius]|uniref:Beta protein n=1 Tax=Phreatobacter stygius TaxID=1940610 RepID=A0A4D7ARF6_9HYPH|nr:beta family protein [Phreatobacter stygius]QCI63944.1 hypothetical protein E8M01_06605 [Phreatobacter stygius]